MPRRPLLAKKSPPPPLGQWRAGEPDLLEAEGRRFSLTPLTRGRGASAVLCEPPVGDEIPEYATRRSLSRALDGEGLGRLVVFSDAARSAEVWSWRTADPLAHHQWVRWPGGGATTWPTPIHGHPDARVLRALLRLHGLRTDAAGEPRQALRDRLEDPRGPGALRGLWRALGALRLLDRSCGTGEWLLRALEALRWIAAACVEQMQLWVDEARLARGRRRPEYLRDFRDLLSRAADPTFMPESIALLNLYGLDRDPALAAACRERLRRAVGSLPAAALNVRGGDARWGIRTRAQLARALVGLPDADARLRRLAGEAALVTRAAERLRAMRLRVSAADGFRDGMRELARRRAGLARELDEAAFRLDGGDPRDGAARRAWITERRPLHLFAETGALSRPGAFHLVREVER